MIVNPGTVVTPGTGFNLAASGAVGTPTPVTGVDHTAQIQTYLNTVSATAAAVSSFSAAYVSCPLLCYRTQNLMVPGNVILDCSGARFQYVDSSLSPPTGVGNYVMVLSGSYNEVRGAVILGNGAAQAGVGGIWCQQAGANPRAYKNVISNCKINNLGHRGVMDQGTNTIWQNGLVQNVLLAQTNSPYFLGAVELAGTDAMVSNGEFTPSVTAGNGQTLGGIAIPRSPTNFLQASLTTTTAPITLPLTNSTISLTATTSFSSTGGIAYIGGVLFAYNGKSGSTLTGVYTDPGAVGTITNPANVYAPIGFCVSALFGGTAQWVRDTDAEVGDVSVFCGPNMLATCPGGITLTTTPQSMTVDTTAHIDPAGGTLTVPNAGAYGSVVWGTTSFNYTGVSGATTVTGAAVASSTLVIPAGGAILSPRLPTQYHTSHVRADLSMTHSWIYGPGGGQMTSPEALRSGVSADNIYYGHYAPSASGGNWDIANPRADSSSVSNRFGFAMVDQNASGANFNRWTKPRQAACHAFAFTGNTAGGWFDLANGFSVALPTGATPSVFDGQRYVDANTGATTITNFVSGVTGNQTIYILQGVNTTIANNSNIVTKSGANISPPGSGFTLLVFSQMGNGSSPTPAWYQQ